MPDAGSANSGPWCLIEHPLDRRADLDRGHDPRHRDLTAPAAGI
jgi:hypothetical protein